MRQERTVSRGGWDDPELKRSETKGGSGRCSRMRLEFNLQCDASGERFKGRRDSATKEAARSERAKGSLKLEGRERANVKDERDPAQERRWS